MGLGPPTVTDSEEAFTQVSVTKAVMGAAVQATTLLRRKRGAVTNHTTAQPDPVRPDRRAVGASTLTVSISRDRCARCRDMSLFPLGPVFRRLIE